MPYFHSTSCLSSNYTFREILEIYNELNIRNVELGVCLDSKLDAGTIIEKYHFNYLIHQLFPPPKDSFILNLASANKEIYLKSVNQIKLSIDFCRKHEIPLVSFHSGFRGDPDNNFIFNFEENLDYDTAFNIFTKALIELVKYSKARNVKIAIENNVLADYNLINNENEILLMCELWEYEKLLEIQELEHLGLLIDLGHLKVTANSLKFDPNVFLKTLKDRVCALHVHENNGLKDVHNCIKEGDWATKVILKYFKEEEIPIINECKIDTREAFENFVEFFSRI
jgi:sugar phosphate isomerase/epimerase